MKATYYYGDEDPTLAVQWLDRTEAAVDLSGATFSVILYDSSGTATLTKTTNISGFSSLQGSSPNQYNLLITFSASELDIAAGVYRVVIKATVSGRTRTFSPNNPPTLQVVTV